MNIEGSGLPLAQFWWFPLTVTAVIIGIVAVILKKRDLF